MGVRKRLGLACLAGVVAAGVMAATALAVGGSANVDLCRDWRTLYRADGTTFKNQGDCVSHVGQGGVATAAYLTWTVDACPFTAPTFCLYLSGVGLKAGTANNTPLEVDVINVHGAGTFPPPAADANGVIAPTHVVVA